MLIKVKCLQIVWKVAFCITFTFIFNSCNDNPVEPGNSLKASRVYTINLADGKTFFNVQCAPIDSLDKFKPIGFEFRSENWLAPPDVFISIKHRLLLISTLAQMYFIDTKTNKLIKTVEMNYTGKNDDSFTSGQIGFLDYDDDNCILIAGNSVFFVSLTDKNIERRIFDGSNISNELRILYSAMTFDKRSLYLITMTKGMSGLPKKLMKIDLMTDKTKLIAQLSPDNFTQDTTGVACLGMTNDYLIYLDSNNDYTKNTGRNTYYKYSIRSDSVIAKKTINGFSNNHLLIPFGKNKLISNRIYGGNFLLIDTDDLSITKYLETNSDYLGGRYQLLNDGLHFLGGDNKGHEFIYNITEKKLKYSFPNTQIHSFIIMEEPE